MMTSRLSALLVGCAALVFAACSGSGSADLSGNSAPAGGNAGAAGASGGAGGADASTGGSGGFAGGNDGGSGGTSVGGSAGGGGTAGTGGSAGMGGAGGVAGSGGDGGTAGSGGAAGDGGSAGIGGTGGAGGSAGTGGASGTGGSGGAGGTGGTGGTGGSAGCSGGCNDNIGCTIDSCVQDTCKHAPGTCPAGLTCDLTAGCVQSPICASDPACIQQWGNDACKTNIHCDAATATCTYALLDNDHDQHAPIVCGGDDCNDADAQRHPGLPEVCDGKDNDCNGAADDGATCPGLTVCQGGACVCPPANQCGAQCVDKNTNPSHCGVCNHVCPATATCSGGTCQCPAGQTDCGSACIDTKSDPSHCGGCTNVCAPGYSCQNSFCTCLLTSCGGSCVDTKTNPSHCGACNSPCPSGATCQNGACVCPPGQPVPCSGVCVNTTTDNNNCGTCGNKCTFGQCAGGQCPTCTPGGMLLLIDVSGSMADTVTGGTRLQAVLSAVTSFVQEPASSGLAVGVKYFPVQLGGVSSCSMNDYLTPDVGIADLPGNTSLIVASMAGRTAYGTSVITAALSGGISATRQWETGHAPRQGAVVMINDGGLGIGCSTETVATATAAASGGLNGSPSVRTYMIGVGTPLAEDSQMWSSVASAGGGTVQSTTALGATAILNALRTIRTTYGCP